MKPICVLHLQPLVVHCTKRERIKLQKRKREQRESNVQAPTRATLTATLSGKHKHQVNGGPSSIAMCRRRSCTGWTEGMGKVSCMGFGVWGLVFGVWCLGFGVDWCLGFGAGRFLPDVRRRLLTARNLHRGAQRECKGERERRWDNNMTCPSHRHDKNPRDCHSHCHPTAILAAACACALRLSPPPPQQQQQPPRQQRQQCQAT